LLLKAFTKFTNQDFYTVSGIDVYTGTAVTETATPAAYFNGQKVAGVFNTNTGIASTINVAGLGIKSIKVNGADPAAGEIDSRTVLVFDLGNDWFEVLISNVYTEAEKTKLAGIETAATADQTAAEVVFTTTGNIVATNVQAAIAEVDTEKAALAGAAFTGPVTSTTLGVGTTTPDTVAEIVGASPILTIRDTQTSLASADARIRLAESGAGDTLDAFWDLVANNSSSNFTFSINEGATQRFSIDAATNSISTHGGALSCGALTSTGIDDNATGERLQISDSSIQVGSSGAAYDITHVVDDQLIFLSGGGADNSGANLILWGGAHATQANDIRFRSGNGTELNFDFSASDWDFQDNAIVTTGALTCGIFTSTGIDDNATGERLQITDTQVTLGGSGIDYNIVHTVDNQRLFVSGGSSSASGANIDLNGGTHATEANDFRFRAGASTELHYDDSASIWIFQANDIITTGDVSCSKIVTPQGNSLTISGGVISVTNSWHRINTEAAAASDDLDTINGFTDGMQLYLRAASSSNTVVLKDETGNLVLAGDFSMDNGDDIIHLIYDGTSGKWKEVSRSDNGV
jgi:hypothetical protein